MKLVTIEETVVELPIQVIALIAIAHAAYDVTAEVRGWGREYMGHGVSAGLDHYSTTMEQALDTNGDKVDCVRLTKRPAFHTGEPETPIDLLFPFKGLKDCALSALVALPVQGPE